MIGNALIIFAIVAVGGLFLASKTLRGELAPWSVGIIHAVLAIAGFGVIIMAVLAGEGGNLLKAVVVLGLITAVLGLYLGSFHARKLPAPMGGVLAHGSIAIVCYLVLIGAFIGVPFWPH
jgi:hypothetical protein